MGASLAGLTRVCHRCDLSDRARIAYSLSAPLEIGAPAGRTTWRVSGSERRTLALPDASKTTTMTTTPEILIIEDDPIMREAMGEWLSAAGYGVRKAADGSAGLAAVKSAPPDLVVTDIHMPGTNGATVISELQRGYPGIPVIAISGLFNSGHGLDADAAIALGAGRTLAKPFKRAELIRAVADLLGRPAG
jgi:CheY-like chemotaxis protein